MRHRFQFVSILDEAKRGVDCGPQDLHTERRMRTLTVIALVVVASMVYGGGGAENATYELMGTAYLIDYPSDWTAARDVMYDRERMVSVVTVISEFADDQSIDDDPPDGYMLVMDHVQMGIMSPALQDGMVLGNLLGFYRQFYKWPEPTETEETSLFGERAIVMKARHDNGSWEYAVMGWADFPDFGVGGYAIQLTAPAGRPLGNTEQIWGSLIQSIRPQE